MQNPQKVSKKWMIKTRIYPNFALETRTSCFRKQSDFVNHLDRNGKTGLHVNRGVDASIGAASDFSEISEVRKCGVIEIKIRDFFFF